MLENKEQEKIAGIISDFFDGAVNEADIDILAMKIYEKYVAKLEQDLEFTTKTANELIEIKHKLEQELAELKQKAIVPKFKIGQEVYKVYTKDQRFPFKVKIIGVKITQTEEKISVLCDTEEDGIEMGWYPEKILFETLEEAEKKLQELKGE